MSARLVIKVFFYNLEQLRDLDYFTLAIKQAAPRARSPRQFTYVCYTYFSEESL